MKIWYLATPYTTYHDGIWAAYIEAAKQAALLISNGIFVYCPISHSHPLATYGQQNITHDDWMALDYEMLKKCDGIIICKMEGWDKSKGVAMEIGWAEELGMTVIEMQPGVVPVV